MNLMSSSRQTAGNTGARLAAIETDVRNISDIVERFVSDSRDWRSHQEIETRRIWDRMEKQGQELGNAISLQGDKMMAALQMTQERSRISWGGIVGTISMMVSIVGIAAALGHHQLRETEAKIEVSVQANKNLIELNRQRLEADTQRVRELEQKAAYTEGIRDGRNKSP